MADEFEAYLAAALAPPTREPDRRFVARVQARVALEARLEADRRSILRRFAVELGAVAVLAGGLVWASRGEPLTVLAAESPWVAMCGLLSIFGLLVVALGLQNGSETASR